MTCSIALLLLLGADPAEGQDALRGFRGLIVGRLVEKDVETGTFSVEVDRIARVWRNNEAKNARRAVGRTVEVEGLQGQFLDKLLVMKRGDTLQFGALDTGGDRLRVGELFRKVAPFNASDYPELPDAFRGFKGVLVAKVEKKDPQIMELIVKATGVKQTWNGNAAEDAESIIGKRLTMAGFYRHREAFANIKVGDAIEAGLNHVPPESDHLTVAEFVRKAGRSDVAPKKGEAEARLGAGAQKFNGMLVGRLVSKDVEKGRFIVAVDRVSRVWRNSKAENPKSLVGKTITVGNVTGKWLDVLLLVKPGETMEFECRHDGGDTMTFPGEMMRKVPPVKPGDYPELPEGFRGFNGAVTATVVKKDAETLELIVRADAVKETWEKNRAKNPQAIVGKRFILAGFWRRRDDFNELKPGDRIDVGLEHISPRSDHLSVARHVRKVEGKKEQEKED